MAIIKVTKRKSKKPQNASAMRNMIDYAKKHEHENGLAIGFNCNTASAFQEFLLNKKIHHKTDGRLYIHMIQSFPKDLITPEKAFELGQKLINEHPQFANFQIVMGTHTDRDHLHNHFCINSVGMDGSKWQLSNTELKGIREKSLDICREADIPIWWDRNNAIFEMDKPSIETNDEFQLNTVHQGEYEKQKQGKSWKYELFLGIKECTKHSHNQDEFIKNMNKLGFGVQWDHHKYITFSTPEGNKCRNNKLYPTERFTKEYLLNQFEKNAERRSQQTIRDHQQQMDHTVNMVNSLLRSVSKNGTMPGNDEFFPLTHIKSKLEGQALKDKAIEKSNSSYDWDNEF